MPSIRRCFRLAAPWCALLALVSGCAIARHPRRLPTGAVLDPAGPSIVLGSMPVTMIFSPDSSRLVVVLSGYREQGLVVVDRATLRIMQRIVQPAAFLGATFSPDGRALFVSGGYRDVVYRYAWSDSARLVDSLALGAPRDSGRVYPAGLRDRLEPSTVVATHELLEPARRLP